MQRTLMLALMLSPSLNAHADCDLRFAPPEVRAAALAFHHHASEHPPVSTDHAVHAAIQRAPRVQHADRAAVIAQGGQAPSR
jgi:hypothetical protein